MENLNLFYPDIGLSSSTVLETMAYNEKYKKVLDEIWENKVELDGMIKEKEEKAIKVKGEAFKEEDDPGAFIFPIRFEEPMGIFTNVLCHVGVTTLIAKFLILDIPIDRDAPIVVGRGFLYTIGGIINTPERLFSTFDGIFHQTFHATRSDVQRTAKSDSDDEEEYEIKRNKFGAPIVWKKVVSFLGSLPVPLHHVDWKPNYISCYTNEDEAKGQWHTEIRLTDPYGNVYVQAFTTKKTCQKLSKYHKIMDPTSSLGRICLGENVYGSPSEKVEGHGDWDAPEYTDTAGSKEKKVTKALSFYKMETEEGSEQYIAPCFMKGLDAYDDYEIKKGNKVVKKELIVALRGELYFVNFIINPKEDDMEPRVILGRSFMRLVNGIVDFGSGVIIVYPEQDPFKNDSEKTEKSMDDWDQLLDFNFDDIPRLDREEL
ncbi:hypothetical protein Tco_1008696 [Tanacetum coccineum]